MVAASSLAIAARSLARSRRCSLHLGWRTSPEEQMLRRSTLGLLRHQMPLWFRTHEDVRRRMLFGWLRHQALFRFRTREDLQLGWLRHQAPFRFRTHEDLQIDSILAFSVSSRSISNSTCSRSSRREGWPNLLFFSRAAPAPTSPFLLKPRLLGSASAEMGSRWCLRRWAPGGVCGDGLPRRRLAPGGVCGEPRA